RRRRGRTREPEDGVQAEIGLRAREHIREVAPDVRERREPVDRLRARRGGAELELRMACDDLERLTTDRPRGTEKRDPFHALSLGRWPHPTTLRPWPHEPSPGVRHPRETDTRFAPKSYVAVAERARRPAV